MNRTPKYSVKQVTEIIEMSPYSVRYYENAGLIPDVDRKRVACSLNIHWDGYAWFTVSG